MRVVANDRAGYATASTGEGRPRLAAAGLLCLLVAMPLVVTRFTADPFGDAKLGFLALGTFLLWISGVRVDRRVAWAAVAFASAVLIAALTGVEPLRSLGVPDHRNADGGFVVLACGAALAVIGAGLSPAQCSWVRRLTVGTGIVVAVIAIVYRLEPDAWNWINPARAMRGATIGAQVFGVAFLTVALGAALASPVRSLWRWAAVVGLLTAGTATFDERSSLVLPVVVLIAWTIRARPPRRVAVTGAAVVLSAIVAYQVAEPLLPTLGRSSRGQFVNEGLPDDRLKAWGAHLDGWTERPVFGWGPGNGYAAFLRGSDPDQLDDIGRGWSDAHSHPVELLSTTGIVGLVTFAVLVGLLGLRAARAGRDRTWALSGFIVLVLFVLIEPINVVTTPMLLLWGGIAAGGRVGADAPTSTGELTDQARLPTVPRTLVTVVLAGTVLLSALLGLAATLERWGTRYGSGRALELSLTVQPWRSTAMYHLARQLSARAASGDGGAEARADELLSRSIADHPWDPLVRWRAAGVEIAMGHEEHASRWFDEQEERFPAERRLIDEARAEARAQTTG